MTSTTSTPLLPKSYLQQARACLGICRYCYEITTPEQPCHCALPDTIVSLEIAVLLLEDRNELAVDRLCHCAEVCANGAATWGHSTHPRCRQSAAACTSFAAFWRGEGALT